MITTRPTFEFFPSLVQWAFAALVGQWLGDGLWLVFLPGALHVLLSLGKPLFYCPGGNLGTRRKPELGEDMADVGLHSTHTHHQFFSNGAIGFALGHQSCHLAFTCGQPAKVLLQSAPWRKWWGRLGPRGARWYKGRS